MLNIWRNETNLPSLIAEVNRLANDFAPTSGSPWDNYGLRPAADILETEGGFEVTLDLPGVDSKAIQLQVQDQTLSVQAERRQAAPQKDATVHRAERAAGTFFRAFELPASVDGTRVEARYDAGVLTVTLPKREEAKPRTIQVKVS